MQSGIPADWSPVKIVATEAELDLALGEWRTAGVLGLDTEANSFYAYSDRLCLLQVSDGRQDYLVDPLALGESLRRIGPLLADPALVKVFHAAEFDLMLLHKDLGARVSGLFDTQVAMTLLRHSKTGLAALIESYFGVQLSKREQRSNWGKRPLTAQQIAYARIDVHFLPELHRRLAGELVERRLVSVAEGEFRRLEREILPPREPDWEGWRRLRGARELPPIAAARLRALYRWREKAGLERDLPVFRILANEVLLDLAQQPPKSIQELAARRGVGWNTARRDGERILSLLPVADSDAAAAVFEKVSPRERQRRRIQRENLEALRQWRKRMAEELGLPSERLIHRRHLEEVGRRLPRTSDQLLRTISLNDWQRQHLEASLLEVLSSLPDPDQIVQEP